MNTGQSVKSAFVILDDIKSEECPRSILIRRPETAVLVQMFHQEQVIKGMGSPGLWPGSLYDAFLVLHEQQEMDANARQEAVRSVI